MTLDEAVSGLAQRLMTLELRLGATGKALPDADRTRLRGRVEGLREALEFVSGRPAEEVLRELSFPEN